MLVIWKKDENIHSPNQTQRERERGREGEREEKGGRSGEGIRTGKHSWAFPVIYCHMLVYRVSWCVIASLTCMCYISLDSEHTGLM